MKVSPYTIVHQRPRPGSKATPRMLKHKSLEMVGGPSDDAVTVGLWDLGAWIDDFPSMLEALNSAQTRFVFYELTAAVPAGLISAPERVIQWAREKLGRLPPGAKAEMQRNVLEDDFYDRAEPIRQYEELDYLAGLTPGMVACEEGNDILWNYISSSRGSLLLVSMADFPEFAETAGRPLGVLALWSVLAQLLVLRHHPKLFFHDDTKCLFDFNRERQSIADAVRAARIDPDCLERIPVPDREAASALVAVLGSYTRR